MALEERIGDVSTGLNEETIMKIMKQKRYTSLEIEIPSDQEPCCICQVRVREKKSKYFLSLDDVNSPD